MSSRSRGAVPRSSDTLSLRADAAAIRALSDAQLDQAAPVSLNSDAPLTCQFMLEDHAATVRAASAAES